ncbi:hypothetical protein ACN47E_009802 [Coniothyrium glycines]
MWSKITEINFRSQWGIVILVSWICLKLRSTFRQAFYEKALIDAMIVTRPKHCRKQSQKANICPGSSEIRKSITPHLETHQSPVLKSS